MSDLASRLEELLRWLRPKIEWTLILLCLLGIGYITIDELIKYLKSRYVAK